MVLFKSGECRFCGTSEGVKINIFDSACDHVSKIEMILPLKMVVSEIMPKVMCHRCMHKINEFYDFRRKCLSLDLKWRARLITLDTNSTSAPVPPVTVKVEPPDPDDSPVEISENTSSAANCGWSFTSESELPNYRAAVTTITTDKQEKQKKVVAAVIIEEDKSKCGDPDKAVPQNNTANKDATSVLAAKRGRKPNRKKTTFSPPKDLKRKRNEKKNDLKNEKESDGKKSVLRTAVVSPALPENTSLTTSHIKTPLQVTPNQDVQKCPSKTPLPEKTVKTAKVQKLKLNVAENASSPPQTSSKEPSNHTANSKVKASPEKQIATVSSKISPRNHQKVISLELPKPPVDSEKPLPPHIIMTSIPNVCTIFTCSLCERTFTSRSLACCHNDCVKMKKNSSSIETDESGSAEGIYACSHCNMKFTRYASLVPHEETHTTNKTAEDSDTLSSSSDEETSRKKKKKFSRSSPVELDSLKNTANEFA